MWKAADVEEGSTVAIFGLGAVGLAVLNNFSFMLTNMSYINNLISEYKVVICKS